MIDRSTATEFKRRLYQFHVLLVFFLNRWNQMDYVNVLDKTFVYISCFLFQHFVGQSVTRAVYSFPLVSPVFGQK